MVELGIELQIFALALPKAGVFSLYLLKGHILMAERSAGRIHVLHSAHIIAGHAHWYFPT
jgi:hypothetical protein